MFDRIGISTRMLLVLSPPFFVLAYSVFTGADGQSQVVVLGAGLSFLLSITISGWHVRRVVEERRASRETAQALVSARDGLRAAERQAARDRALQRGFVDMEEVLLGGLSVHQLAQEVIEGLARYTEAAVGAIYLRDASQGDIRFVCAGSYALDETQRSRSYLLGEGLVGQVARDGQAVELSSPSDSPLVVDDGLRRRGAPGFLVVWPVKTKSAVIGVITIGVAGQLNGDRRRFAERILRSVAMAFETALARQSAENTLDDYKSLANQLQEQQQALKDSNQRLEDQAAALEWAHWEAEVRNQDLQRAEGEAARKADEAAQATRIKSEFLANMSHELRTPLNSVILLSKLLAEGRSGDLTPSQTKQVTVINQAGNDLLNLINDILDLSKIEAGRMDVVVEAVDVGAMVQELSSLFEPLVSRRGVAMTTRIDEDAPLSIDSDGARIKQILRNFMSNASKFVHDGHVELSFGRSTPRHVGALRGQGALAAQVAESPDDFVVFAVEDTGIGIPKDRQDAIFEAFRQADGTTSREYGGTGLGLSIVTNLAVLLGGGVGLWSEEGVGSTFFVVLPVRWREPKVQDVENAGDAVAEGAAADTPPEHLVTSADAPRFELDSGPPADAAAATPAFEMGAQTAPSQRERPDDWGSGLHLLLVDDNIRNTYALSIVLEAEGFRVTAANNGAKALEALDAHDDVVAVLMDMMMPVMDGYEACRRLRANPRHRNLPVIALTARSQPGDLQACLAAGADHYLSKPIDNDVLMRFLYDSLNPEGD